jgi:hypothetical protein
MFFDSVGTKQNQIETFSQKPNQIKPNDFSNLKPNDFSNLKPNHLALEPIVALVSCYNEVQ